MSSTLDAINAELASLGTETANYHDGQEFQVGEPVGAGAQLAIDLEPASAPEVSEVKAPVLGELIRQPIRIVRAAAGNTELRLLRQTQTGSRVVQHFIESSKLQPYVTTRNELKAHGKPMKRHRAMQAFDQMVAENYPPIKLGNGKVVASCHSLL